MKIAAAQYFGVAVLLLACSCHHSEQHASRPYQYLGLPHNADYPNNCDTLDSRVQGYYRVFHVEHVDKSRFEDDVNSGRALFSELHEGTQYYSVKHHLHVSQTGQEGHDWVWVLLTRAYP